MSGKSISVVKIGSNIVNEPTRLAEFLTNFQKLPDPKILVHGGGELATEMAERLGLEVKKIEGRRITDKATLDVITMVYGGKVNKSIVAQLQALGCQAVGLSGADGDAIRSHKRKVAEIDYGFVGDIDNINVAFLKGLVELGCTPVFSAITHDGFGQLLNTNADTIASELAAAFAAEFEVALYFVFEKQGVLRDLNRPDSVIERIDEAGFHQLKSDGVIHEGMLPKIHNALQSVKKGVSKVCIGSHEMISNTESIFTTVQ